MAPLAKGGQTPTTPGRRRKTQDQYFDVGKVGRKTGITLKDTGVRDEHGLEPMDGIFSSPVSPAKLAQSSSDAMQLSSGQDVNETLHLRKTPRLPPPRQSTPKHTHIGSPKRGSASRPQMKSDSESTAEAERSLGDNITETQQPPNRLLSFSNGNTVMKSIESGSPFKPRNTLRRSMGGPPRPNPFASPGRVAKPVETMIGAIDEDEGEKGSADAADSMPTTPGALQGDDEVLEELRNVHSLDDGDGGFPVIQDGSFLDTAATDEERNVVNAGIAEHSAQQSPPWYRRNKKRDRRTFAARHGVESTDHNISHSQLDEDGHSVANPRGRPRTVRDLPEQTIDPILSHHNEDQADEDEEQEDDPAPAPKRSKGKTGRQTTVELNDTNGATRSPNRRSYSRGRSIGAPAHHTRISVGPSNNFQLRATTPFEDAGGRVSRYGRTLTEPLKYWANETKIWRNGEVDHIIRADEVEEQQKRKPRKKKSRKTTKKSASHDVYRDSEDESVQPEAWEDELGVIVGDVAKWDHERQEGDPTEPIRDDIAFAATSMVPRDVAGSNFKYAKIVTAGFFGSGIVELPPGGFKRPKNSRKMEMAFFVVEGKVTVEVGMVETGINTFAITKGGCWVVSRGNNYSITNESSTRTAKLWFAQGCEADRQSAEF